MHRTTLYAGLLILLVSALPLTADVTTLNVVVPFLLNGTEYTQAVAINDNSTVLVSSCCGLGSPETGPGPDIAYYNNGQLYTNFASCCTFTIPFDLQGPLQVFDNPFAPSKSATPVGFNDGGVIIGNYTDIFSDSNGFLLPDFFQGGMTLNYPGSQPGFSSTSLNGINDSGTIVGNYTDYLNSVTFGFIYQNGIFTPLSFAALAINNNGQIVGQAANGDIVVDTNGLLRDLGLFPFTPAGVNNSLDIVGGDYLYGDGVFTQLQIPGAGSVSATGINDSNTTVGSYFDANGHELGFILTPEPGYQVPLLAGVFAMALFAWRSRTKAQA